MSNLKSKRGPASIAGQAFGVAIALEADDEADLCRMAEWLPPGWLADAEGTAPVAFKLTKANGSMYTLLRDGTQAGVGALDATLDAFERMLRVHIARSAPGHVFVHAGTVGHAGRAIVIPGLGFSGKTTLVGALVGTGAVYYSDEYAVIDRDGLVHPYPKPLSVRIGADSNSKRHHRPEQLGFAVGDDPIPIGLIVCTQYRKDSDWQPIELTPAEATLELLVHAFSDSARAEESIAMLGRAVLPAAAVKGNRGEAAGLVSDLLRRVAGEPS